MAILDQKKVDELLAKVAELESMVRDLYKHFNLTYEPDEK